MLPMGNNLDALDQLLLERFGGKVGRGLALELSRRRDFFQVSPSVTRAAS